MQTSCVPGVNHPGNLFRWADADFTEVDQDEADFKAKVESQVGKMIDAVATQPAQAV